MRVLRLILGALFILLGAFDLYRAFQKHGDFFAYLIGGLFVVLGVAFFARFFPKPRQ